MQNITLNLGGFFGALAGGAVMAFVEFVVLKRHETSSRTGRLFILGVIGGATAGNFLWAKIFPAKTKTKAKKRRPPKMPLPADTDSE